MVRCKDCYFFYCGLCYRLFNKTGCGDDLRLVDEDAKPCEFAKEPEVL